MRTNTASRLSSALFVLLIAPGCATLIQKRTQSIPVTSSPPGAAVSVNGQPQGRTPLELRLARKGKDQVIRIESPGYDPVEIRPRRKLAAHFVLGNALVGVAVGLVPTFFWMLRNDDMPTHGTPYLIWSASAAAVGALLTVVDIGGSGKGYEWSPADLEVTLKKADGTPRVQTIVVEAPDLGSIRWIRVRRD